MPNPKRQIVFTQACPQIAWAGGLAAHPYFSVRSSGAVVGSAHKDGAAEVGVVTHVPAEDGGREVKKVFLDYRMVFHDGFKSRWHSSMVPASDRVFLGKGANGVYSGAFAVAETMDDGAYEVRAVAECTEEASSSPHDTSATTPIKGLVDREAPTLVSFTSSSLSGRHGAGDVFVLTFSEEVVCKGRLADGEERATVKMAINFGVKASYTVAAKQLKYSCEGARMTVSVPHPHEPDASAGTEVPSITIEKRGVVDVAGNPLERIDGRRLVAGRAGEERQMIAGKVDSAEASINTNVNDKVSGVETKITGVETKIIGMESNLNQSNHEAHREIKASITSLASMVASLVKAGGGTAAAFPGTTKPASAAAAAEAEAEAKTAQEAEAKAQVEADAAAAAKAAAAKELADSTAALTEAEAVLASFPAIRRRDAESSKGADAGTGARPTTREEAQVALDAAEKRVAAAEATFKAAEAAEAAAQVSLASAKSTSAAASAAASRAAVGAAVPSPSPTSHAHDDDDNMLEPLVIAVLVCNVLLVVLVLVKIGLDAKNAGNGSGKAANERRLAHFEGGANAGRSTVRMGPGSDEYLTEEARQNTARRGSSPQARAVSDMLADEAGVPQGGNGSTCDPQRPCIAQWGTGKCRLCVRVRRC